MFKKLNKQIVFYNFCSLDIEEVMSLLKTWKSIVAFAFLLPITEMEKLFYWIIYIRQDC